MSLLGSLGTVSSAVGSFQSLVENATANSSSVSNAVSNAANSVTNTVSNNVNNAQNTASTIGNTVSNAFSNLSNTLQSTAETLLSSLKVEFTKELYDKAIGLAEALSVNLPVYEDNDKYKYGLFNGKKIYKDLAGNIDLSAKDIKSCYGWLTVDKSSNEHVIFSNNNVSYIISYADFQSKSVVKDFTPLYNKLSEANRAKDSYIDDTSTVASLSTTYKDDTSNAIAADSTTETINSLTPDEFKQAKKADYNYLTEDNPFLSFYGSNKNNDKETSIWKDKRDNKLTGSESFDQLYSKKSEFSSFDKNRKNWLEEFKYTHEHGVSALTKFKKPIADTAIESKNHIDYRSVQAIIYDLDESNKTSAEILYCYQQPESISYTAAASYESQSPRGAQQPFQFYTGANAITLSFELKFHYDELFTINKDVRQPNVNCLQRIADIAEDFTRPYKSGNSLKPKLVKVLLPGISEMGYMTEATISYSGDMMGNLSAADVANSTYNNSYNNGHLVSTNYFYNLLTISFSMIIVNDIKLIDYGIHSNIDNNYDIINNTITSDVQDNRKQGSYIVIPGVSNATQKTNVTSQNTTNATDVKDINASQIANQDSTSTELLYTPVDQNYDNVLQVCLDKASSSFTKSNDEKSVYASMENANFSSATGVEVFIK